MAAVTYRDHLPATSSAIDFGRIGLAFGDTVLSMIEAFKAERAKLQTRRALNNLSDAMLADIGISRGEIVTITK